MADSVNSGDAADFQDAGIRRTAGEVEAERYKEVMQLRNWEILKNNGKERESDTVREKGLLCMQK